MAGKPPSDDPNNPTLKVEEALPPYEEKATLTVDVQGDDDKETKLSMPVAPTVMRTAEQSAPKEHQQNAEGGREGPKLIEKWKAVFNPKLVAENDLVGQFLTRLFDLLLKVSVHLAKVAGGGVVYGVLLPAALVASACAPFSPGARELAGNYWKSLGGALLTAINPENAVYGIDWEKKMVEEEAKPRSELPSPPLTPSPLNNEQSEALQDVEKKAEELRREPIGKTLPISPDGEAVMHPGAAPTAPALAAEEEKEEDLTAPPPPFGPKDDEAPDEHTGPKAT